MGLCANTFTLVHSSFERSMENILSPGFSCSLPNLASAKVRNVADLKIFELQNQYLNKKLLSQVEEHYVESKANVHITDVSRGTKEPKTLIFCLTSLHFCYFALLFYYLHHFNLETCYDNTTAKSSNPCFSIRALFCV